MSNVSNARPSETATDNQTRDVLERPKIAFRARKLPPGASLMELPKEWPGMLEFDAILEIGRLRAENDELQLVVDGLQSVINRCKAEGVL